MDSEHFNMNIKKKTSVPHIKLVNIRFYFSQQQLKLNDFLSQVLTQNFKQPMTQITAYIHKNKLVYVLFTMSPSCNGRLSGIPWQITSFIDLNDHIY